MAKFLVTGCSGFVGKALVVALLKAGHQVLGVSRKKVPELLDLGAHWQFCDLTDPKSILSLNISNFDAVFHTAAYVKMWGKYRDFYQTNYEGTKYLLEHAEKSGVGKFIYTSSPSVIADGQDLCGINESYPYPRKYKAFYPQTKAMAEKLVLASNQKDFQTLSLRPHLIWGPGDQNLVPTILAKAKAGRLKIIGQGRNRVDVCYIDDCIDAHLCAYAALGQNPKAAGKAYFISQGEPVLLWDWINQILTRSSLSPIQTKIPYPLAISIATILEWISKSLPNYPEPLFTRFLVSEMATDHYFDISRAREMLSFTPKVSIAEGLERTFQ